MTKTKSVPSRRRRGLRWVWLLPIVVAASLGLRAGEQRLTRAVALSAVTGAPPAIDYDTFISAAKRVDDRVAKDLDTLRQVVATNAPALALARQALTQPGQRPLRENDRSPLMEGVHIRRMTRAFGHEASLYAAEGAWDRSAATGVDVLRMANALEPGAGQVLLLVIGAPVITGCRTLWTTVDHVDAATARRLAGELETLTDQAQPLAVYLRNEQETVHRQLDAAKADAEVKAVRADYDRYSDALIAAAGQPYGAEARVAPAKLPAVAEAVIDPAGALRLRCRYEQWVTHRRLVATAFALRAWRLEHGSYPSSLSALVPELLKRVPTDPFSGDALHYQCQEQTYRLYSVGPDQRDDGGRPVTNEVLHTTPDFFSPDSQGDIVAGQNAQGYPVMSAGTGSSSPRTRQ